MSDEQHVYYHNDNDGPRVNVKVVQNTKGFNYEVTVMNAMSVEEAMKILVDAQTQLAEKYGASE
jgi:hypothetical protein